MKSSTPYFRSDDAVDLSGWSLQYAAATSDNWSATPLSGIIQAGGYYLIALHSGANGIDLPTPDKSGTSNFAVTGGKIALVSSTADLSGNCPADESIVDLIGYGTNVSCHWGDAPAAALNNAPQSALTRLNNGCHSLRDNAADFVLMNVSPQNSASTPEICDRWHLSESRALFYDDWNLVAEIDTATGNIIATYLHGADIDEIVAQKSGNSIAYYIADHLGSVRAITDANGNIVEHYRYEAFGQPTIFNADGALLNSSALGNRFMFTGREYLPSIGLYDYRNRTYSPTMGRFIEVDPLRLSAGDLNMYRYVGNGVLRWTDPMGLYTEYIYWTPMGIGASFYGHASIIINGVSFSWGKNIDNYFGLAGDNMDISSAESYIAKRDDLSDGFGIILELSEEQELALEEYFWNLSIDDDMYILFSNNCMQVIERGLQSVGVDVNAWFTPESLFYVLQSMFPNNEVIHHPHHP